MKDAKKGTWHYLWNIIRYRPGLYFLMTLQETLVFTAAPLATGIIVRAIFDNLTNSAPLSFNVWTLCAFIVAVGLAKALVFITNFATFFYYQVTIGTLLRKNLFSWILDRPGAQALPDSSGEAISRFRGDVKGILDVLERLNFVIEWSLFAIVGISIMLSIDVRITLFVMIPLVIIVMTVSLARRRIQRYHDAVRKATGGVTGFIAEMFGSAQAIKASVAEPRVLGRFRILNERRRSSDLKAQLFRSLLNSVSWNMASLGTGLILIMAGGAMRSGSFTVGDFALFVIYIEMVAEFAAILGEFLAMYKQTGVCLKRLFHLLQGAPRKELVKRGPVYLRGKLPRIPPIARSQAHRLEGLEAQGMSYRYPQSDRGIHNVNLYIQRGTFTVLTGRIGSGKTTLLRVLLGLLPKDEGFIYWNGDPVEDPASFFVPPRTAYTAQVPVLFSESIKDNLLMGLPEEKADIDNAIHLSAMEQDLLEMGEGLLTPLGVKGVRLSGGQKQRLAAARMFVRNPELFVFDDLSSALDVQTERILWDRLFELKGKTFLAVSHRRFVLRKADRIIVLKDGRIQSEGTPAEVLANCQEMRAVWGDE
jgi:ATP-binding cassette subfamily B protein